jgi:hypothetical protein
MVMLLSTPHASKTADKTSWQATASSSTRVRWPFSNSQESAIVVSADCHDT